MKIPRNARFVINLQVKDREWIDCSWLETMEGLLHQPGEWESDRVVAWLLTHPSGVYAVWSKRYDKPIKIYPDLETAKVAVELNL